MLRCLQTAAPTDSPTQASTSARGRQAHRVSRLPQEAFHRSMTEGIFCGLDGSTLEVMVTRSVVRSQNSGSQNAGSVGIPWGMYFTPRVLFTLPRVFGQPQAADYTLKRATFHALGFQALRLILSPPFNLAHNLMVSVKQEHQHSPAIP